MRTRPLVPGQDEDFVFVAYCCSRSEEIACWGLSARQAADFLHMQHQLQRRSYQRTYPCALWHIVALGELRVGYLCLAREVGTTTLVDIALLAPFRGRGLGTALLRELQAEACRDRADLRLSVRIESPARRLYERLGFRIVFAHELYLELSWSPSSARVCDQAIGCAAASE